MLLSSCKYRDSTASIHLKYKDVKESCDSVAIKCLNANVNRGKQQHSGYKVLEMCELRSQGRITAEICFGRGWAFLIILFLNKPVAIVYLNLG